MEIESNQETLPLFAARFLKQVLFGEMSIDMNDQAIEERVEQRKERIEQREQKKSDQKQQQMESDFKAI